MERCGAIAASNGERHMRKGGEEILELFDERTLHDPAALKRFCEVLFVVLVKIGLANGNPHGNS